MADAGECQCLPRPACLSPAGPSSDRMSPVTPPDSGFRVPYTRRRRATAAAACLTRKAAFRLVGVERCLSCCVDAPLTHFRVFLYHLPLLLSRLDTTGLRADRSNALGCQYHVFSPCFVTLWATCKAPVRVIRDRVVTSSQAVCGLVASLWLRSMLYIANSAIASRAINPSIFAGPERTGLPKIVKLRLIFARGSVGVVCFTKRYSSSDSHIWAPWVFRDSRS